MIPEERVFRNQMDNGFYEPFLRHIRFPRFKNLVEGARIDFNYPITAIVGPNGTNKSSILRAIQGCPDFENIGNHWFTTNLDPIDDTQRHRFIHGYKTKSGKMVESIKSRIAEPGNPDYWEPSRPLLSGHDNMEKMPEMRDTAEEDRAYRSKTRWKAIQKSVIYLDFRYHISAFDLFYTLDGGKVARDRSRKKKFLRQRTRHLKNAIVSGASSYSFHQLDRVESPAVSLDEKYLSWIIKILGRKYHDVQIIEHSFYEIPGFTVTLADNTLEYSEAFAGSGEYTVVLMVKRILDAPRASLIILDEPEVSLHPRAQQELMNFLHIMSIENAHQIVIATHSPSIVESLPSDAIKMMALDENTGKSQVVAQSTFPIDAFRILGAKVESMQIFVEDELARLIVQRNLRHIEVNVGSGDDTHAVDVIPLGGGGTIITRDIPAIVRQKRSCLVLLDGDQKPCVVDRQRQPKLDQNGNEVLGIPSVKDLPESELMPTLESIGIKKTHIGLSGGNASNTSEYLEKAKEIIGWAERYLHYLPSQTPESLLIDVLEKHDEMEPGQTSKAFWEACADRQFSNVNGGAPSAADILSAQKAALNKANMDHPHFQSLQKVLREFVGRKQL